MSCLLEFWTVSKQEGRLVVIVVVTRIDFIADLKVWGHVPAPIGIRLGQPWCYKVQAIELKPIAAAYFGRCLNMVVAMNWWWLMVVLVETCMLVMVRMVVMLLPLLMRMMMPGIG